jgi:hypothetical protein
MRNYQKMNDSEHPDWRAQSRVDQFECVVFSRTENFIVRKKKRCYRMTPMTQVSSNIQDNKNTTAKNQDAVFLAISMQQVLEI